RYRLKHPGDTGTRHDGPPTIKLTVPAPRQLRTKIKIS
ncbi:MAG: hypothetical protein JWL68_1319, partial [Actinomycetia bacterium]|nr:hypothetical protein [Actinomycetes bacterium]